MQRREQQFVVISCDFCGTDWDEVRPMIEGHHGSVLCLECLKLALDALATREQGFHCSLCLRDLPGSEPHWRPPPTSATPVPPGLNPQAIACKDCINQAAGTFSKDPDVDWKRPRA